MNYIFSPKFKAETKQILNQLKKLNKSHYVYLLHRPDGTPFYVGKGQNMRVFCHEIEAKNTSRKSHKLNVIRKILDDDETLLYSIADAFDTHEEALLEEKRLIAMIGRYDLNNSFPLTNQTDGGEGTLNPSEKSKEKHRQTLAGIYANDPDVATANKFLSKFCKVSSNPIKSVKKYGSSIDTLHKNRDAIGKKPRNAGALVAMAVAQSVLLRPCSELLRRFSIHNVDMILENGCGRDMLVNGMIELANDTPKHEVIRITQSGYDYLLKSYGLNRLISYGVLSE